VAEVEAALPGWLPDAPTHRPLAVVNDDVRLASRVVRIAVGQPAAYELIVKTSMAETGPAAAATAPDPRPRLAAVAPAAIRPALELRVLRAVEALFARDDARFGAVKALGIVDDGRAVVTVAIQGVSLGDVLRRGRKAMPAINPEEAVGRAGAWLRTFHDGPPFGDLESRQAPRDEVVAAIRNLGEYLRAAAPSRGLDRVIEDAVTATGVLPPELDVRPVHGDFAPRNLIIGRDGRLTAIDLLGRWRAPIYEDLGTFLVALGSGRLPAVVGEWTYRRPRRVLESAFLTGYFGSDPRPDREIALYEALLLLDKWSARLSRLGRRGVRARFERAALERHFLGRAQARIREARRA
jgi:Ser/Thr protein kinase RdoA (MazF antagonist)